MRKTISTDTIQSFYAVISPEGNILRFYPRTKQVYRRNVYRYMRRDIQRVRELPDDTIDKIGFKIKLLKVKVEDLIESKPK